MNRLLRNVHTMYVTVVTIKRYQSFVQVSVTHDLVFSFLPAMLNNNNRLRPPQTLVSHNCWGGGGRGGGRRGIFCRVLQNVSTFFTRVVSKIWRKKLLITDLEGPTPPFFFGGGGGGENYLFSFSFRIIFLFFYFHFSLGGGGGFHVYFLKMVPTFLSRIADFRILTEILILSQPS